MQIQEMNRQLISVLDEWDPFQIGAGQYETEIADVIQAVHDTEDKNMLGRKIQAIYEFSFEQMIPLENCKNTAVKLLTIKNSGSCRL
ncbi:hypothetical protein J2Z40_001043 [Cytobacillus eiseniae]|uniref:DUF1871 domain-containing protein n=1 Tax=Cytobacillus eiseniae TaxID=762947 RepID=A0ABS4RCM4_9BACI|nr:DUF1871 family protein [Cytobacillus eiseniae]MBP2240488.1 hypothetical protein [Cytobacillus eiseniae]